MRQRNGWLVDNILSPFFPFFPFFPFAVGQMCPRRKAFQVRYDFHDETSPFPSQH